MHFFHLKPCTFAKVSSSDVLVIKIRYQNKLNEEPYLQTVSQNIEPRYYYTRIFLIFL